MNTLISNWIFVSHQLSPFLLSVIEFLFLSFALLFLFWRFEKLGVFVFMTLGILVGNIQILTHVDFTWITIPLGTISFSMLFVASNLLNLSYGKQVAKQAVLLTFYAQIFFALLMMITIDYIPTSLTQDYHAAIKLLFSPALRLFVASLISYTISQFFDIYLFDALKKQNLFSRFNVSIWISSFLDNTLFSFLAFYFFANEPYSLTDIFFHFILGTYWIRILIGLFEMSIFYLAMMIIRKKNIKAMQ